MIFAFLLLQLVQYNVEGKHFLVETNGKHLLVETKDEKNITGKGRNGSDYTAEGKKGEECIFSRDCEKIERCADLEYGKDCRCFNGKCFVYSDGEDEDYNYDSPEGVGHECETYKDCSCKSDPKNCFCDIFTNKYGRSVHRCVTQARECHQTSDCAALKKCKGRDCRCEQDACEWQCNETKDCENKEHFCHTSPQHTCECSRYYTGIDYNSECYANEKPVKCNKVKDCEDKKHDCHTDPDYFCKCEEGHCRSLDRWIDAFEEEVTCKETKECEKLCHTENYSDYTDDYTCKCETGNCVMVPKAIV